ncbi:MAG: hypothetical protein ILP09_06225 [Oscillospiraceae bacterium]|nr:hypothetical protein [Oscillospiraceae bacterium]
MAEMMKNFTPPPPPKDGEKAPAPAPMWGTPEGGEAFGQARKDLDWVDASKRSKN